MKSIVIIGCYFGKMRNDFEMWANSCKNNETIDWIIFSDHKNIENLPNNVKNIYIEFEDLVEYIEKKLDMKISLEKPYKLCDYKVAYGYIFSEYIKEYDYWGYCDFDMLFGNLRNFITDELLSKFDKIYYQGHLSIYKNTKEVNARFMKKEEKLYYKEVFQTSNICVFDEINGIYDIYINNKWPMYVKNNYADILKNHNRFRLAGDPICKHINYKKQTFLYEKGNLYRVYVDYDNKIEKEELSYIHYSGRDYNSIKEKNNFFITNEGFIARNDQEKIDIKTIEKMNPPKNQLLENIKINVKYFIFIIKRKCTKILDRRKNERKSN